MNTKKKILIAPLNWGLGHATRCIPIIKALEQHNYTPIIASDGDSLSFLQKEFPHLTALDLPSYNVVYSESRRTFKWKMAAQIPKIIKAIQKEKIAIQKIIEDYQIDGIISDNRLGIYSKNIPSVFITHQLNVLSGTTSWITTKVHSRYIAKFNQCWIPDFENFQTLSGILGHLKKPLKNCLYIGPLSRFEKKSLPIRYDLMVILSGPEPQRTLLEEKLSVELKKYKGQIIFIKGIVEVSQKTKKEDNITFYNFMNSEALEIAFNESNAVLCRSGYTTIMDLAKLNKKAFFIPTPGQYEQEYLAKKYKMEGVAPRCKQENFKYTDLNKIQLYRGFDIPAVDQNWEQLFSLFQSK
ncbi:glycosyltransferase family protein [Flavobacterium ardleyense]|uniref:Glycosyltransferase family protein n=1 Tax=Flavobacterium ardleyense TaxID=2038737 RepID=A0ABW5Z7T5_9FLAO